MMTPAQGRTALIVALAVVAVLLAVSLARQVFRRTNAETQLAEVQATLRTVQAAHARTDDALDSARGLVYASRRTVDSITVEMRRVRLTPRPVRQWSPRVTDTSDQIAVVAALADITAERDTALLDLAAVREQAELIQQHCDALRTASIEHARALEAQLQAAQASLATADSAATVAAKTVHRGRLRRLWDGTKRVATTTGALGVGVILGRASR